MDIHHIDIAHYTGHKALEELGRAHWLYTVPIAQALKTEGVHVVSLDSKAVHDIELLALKTRVTDLNIDYVDHINAFHWSGFLRNLRKKEGERCINAAIFFQAMMEADINSQLGKMTDRKCFERKWQKFFDENNAPESIRQSFQDYLVHIYRGIRNPAVHAKNLVGGLNPESLRFPMVHSNLRKGWDCFVFLLGVKHGCQMDYDNNWKTMCGIHHIPAVLDAANYPDMGLMSEKMIQKHLDSLNAGS